ncbi:MAG: flagellar assembly protein FliW [Candidatus Firestonebacteria bacterium]|nr:flagellar assembly protein FliW [Candidatus Firestonebacteria bacterium]
MKFKTRHFGEIEIAEEKLLTFPGGIIGFPNHKKFCLINRPESNPYFWLQCVDQPEWAFVVLPMQVFKPDYQLELKDAEKTFLKLTPEDTAVVLAVVVVPSDPHQTTVNLLAPIVINEREFLGAQVVNENGLYQTRHLLKDEIKPVAKEGDSHAGAHEKEKTVCHTRG